MHNDRFTSASPRCIFLIAVVALLFGWMILLPATGLTPAVHAQEQPVPTGQPYDPAQVTVPLSPPSAWAGLASYQQNCAPCHGEEGLGDGPTVPDLPGPPTVFADGNAIWSLSPAMFFHTTKFGRLEKGMPPWSRRLSDDEIWNTVAYAWSLHTTEAEVAQGEVLYAESCASCHGPRGAGDGPDAEGELPDFTDPTYVTFVSQADWQAGWQTAHPEIGGEWSSADQAATLEYMRTFSYNPPWVSPYEPGLGIINGTVRQATPDGTPIAGLPVALEAYLEFDQVANFTTTVTADGTFRFDDLSTDPSLAYIASIVVDNISYNSDFISLSPISRTVTTDLTIYGVTDDPANVYLDRNHLILDHQPGALLVGEIYLFGNDGDRTYIGQTMEGADQPVTVGIRVPAAAAELSFDNGEIGNRFLKVGDTYYDTLPVVPGESTRQIIVRYALPYEGTAADFQQEFLYPVDSFSMLVADLPGLQVEAPALEFVNTQDMQGQVYQIWRAADLAPQAVDLKLSGLMEVGAVDPRATTTDAAGEMPLGETLPPLEPWLGWLMGGLAAAGLLAAVGVAMQRGTVRTGYTRQDLASLHDDLLGRIAHIDDRRALGEISEAEWLKQRAQLKAQLVDVIQRQNFGKRAAG